MGPAGRTSKESLFAFANLTEHDTLHPSTELGRIMEAHQELSACFHVENPIAQNMANNVWALASFMFVLGSEMQEQSTVVALVNKELGGERPLKQSVLFKHEMPTLGIAAYGLGHWSPQVLVIDMLGTCHRTGPALRHQLLSGGAAWYPVLQKFQFLSATDFAQRSTMSWTCWDCPESSCHLDVALAQAVQRVREALGCLAAPPNLQNTCLNGYCRPRTRLTATARRLCRPQQRDFRSLGPPSCPLSAEHLGSNSLVSTFVVRASSCFRRPRTRALGTGLNMRRPKGGL